MRFRIKAAPAVFRRRYVAVLLPPQCLPRLARKPRSFERRESVRVAAMMMKVIHQGDRQLTADREQVTHRIADVIVFDCQAGLNRFRQMRKDSAKALQRSRLVTVDSSGMN